MICLKCKTENGYARIETKDWVCRKCGMISPIKFKEKLTHPKEEIKIKEEPSKETLIEQRKKYLEE